MAIVTGDKFERMLALGASFGSFVVRFRKRFESPYYSFDVGKTLSLHERHWEAWNNPAVTAIPWGRVVFQKAELELVEEFLDRPDEPEPKPVVRQGALF